MKRGPGRLRALARRSRLLRAAVRLVRRWGPHQRALRRLQRRHPGRLLQPSPRTRQDRYPAIFAFVADRLRDHPAPTILSYGCSTGEEVFSLRRYLPRASITGVDINPRSIDRARARLRRSPDPRLTFGVCADPSDLPPGAFDAVFCMAVLRHGDLLADDAAGCGHLLPFARAEACAAALAARVRPAGYLAIWCTQFRFTDMAPSAAFQPVMTAERGAFFNQPLYGRDDRRIDGAAYALAVFRRH